MLEYFGQGPVQRKYLQNNLTFGLLYAFTENFVLVLSHDEVVHGKRALLDKMPDDEWQRFANVLVLLGYMYGHPGRKSSSWAWNSVNGGSGTTIRVSSGTGSSMLPTGVFSTTCAI